MDDFAHKVLEREAKLENSWGHVSVVFLAALYLLLSFTIRHQQAYYWPGHRVVPYHSYKLLDVEKDDDWWIPDGVLV